ncbi:hypothetical protein HMF3257_11345 [Spirosoma telluris]|uniref:Uncharacterized protein n=2 Tax=Spirosoma telluris TaxID=2183553 RepID=A0A327NKX2_9BACT|nr:hypothetical protein HMF3257_11345 [Spirosoma telluris]
MFNRPAQALRVFERIREVKPESLYLTVDGPRPDRLADNEATKQCQEIATLVDWPCTIHTLFRAENLGCRQAVSSAINWFFEHVEAGIILEDDCLPDLTFFDFCQVLLQRYVNEPKIMHIGELTYMVTIHGVQMPISSPVYHTSGGGLPGVEPGNCMISP